MKSSFIKVVEEILQFEGPYFIDSRKIGYRIKFLFIHAKEIQMDTIHKLPHVIKCKNIVSKSTIYGCSTYKSLAVHVDCKPSQIVL